MSENIKVGKRKIIFLVNPISGTSKKTKVVQYIEKTLTRKGIYYQILPTHKYGNYDDVAEEIQEEQITDVVIVGGDGSVNQVVGALHKSEVNFGIIPVGSGNGLARTAGIPMNPKKALEVVLTGTPEYIDAFMVNDSFACMLAGLGLDAQIAHDFAESNTRGLFTYVRESIKAFFKANPYSFEVEINGDKFFTDAYFISVANANQFGNNFTIAPKADLKDGLLDIVIVQNMKKGNLPFSIVKHLRGNNPVQEDGKATNNQNILYLQSNEVKIINSNLAPIHIDGEPSPTQNYIKFQNLPRCFKLIKKNL